jgi:hypothetical protein
MASEFIESLEADQRISRWCKSDGTKRRLGAPGMRIGNDGRKRVVDLERTVEDPNNKGLSITKVYADADTWEGCEEQLKATVGMLDSDYESVRLPRCANCGKQAPELTLAFRREDTCYRCTRPNRRRRR